MSRPFNSVLANEDFIPTHKVVLEIGAGHLKTQMLSEGFPEVVRPRRSRPTSSFSNTDATS